MARGTFGARVAHCIVGAPHPLFLSCPILYLCGFLKVLGLGSGLQQGWVGGSTQRGIQEESPGLAWSGSLPYKWAQEEKVSALLLPPNPQNPVKWGRTSPPAREMSLSEEGGRGAGLMIAATGHPQ